MSSRPPIVRRRPLTSASDNAPSLPEPAPSQQSTIRTPLSPIYVANSVLKHSPPEGTPSPLRQLERGWKEKRRLHLKDASLRAQTNSVRFAITSSTSALLTPPSTPPPSQNFAIIRKDANNPIDTVHTGLSSGSNCTINPEQPVNSQTATSARNTDTPHHIRPILSYPLPSTSCPVPLIKGKKDTINVSSPGSMYEVILRLEEGRVVKVRRGGFIAELFMKRKGQIQERLLDMKDVGKWTETEKRDWQNISDVISDFKRMTIRVKMFLPLGHLRITCSSPPDIILTFQTDSLSKGYLAPNADSKTREINQPQVRDDNRWEVQVRMLYSRYRNELKIDTYTYHARKTYLNRGFGCLKTKRTIPLLQQDDMLRRQPTAKDVNGITAEDVANTIGIQRNTEIAEWKEEEREALKRLWTLRHEWERWDDF
ncbi:uncharacterized protein I206_106801 [Kwoniella pini CBS 10737]|uniref:Uncharacterized protein n=1 Tax=Kwoniella pini CBS 10737 TaxID=1296096 RepID=A0A1B9I027_9TREE|nr:uncharacterized protein I206_05651 [Kwoniella pini CBS 10737]OCF48870.1 hypothetical protein I206_05651 [Kwoniella pini CBS 10737]